MECDEGVDAVLCKMTRSVVRAVFSKITLAFLDLILNPVQLNSRGIA